MGSEIAIFIAHSFFFFKVLCGSLASKLIENNIWVRKQLKLIKYGKTTLVERRKLMIGKKSEKKRSTLTCYDFTDITAPCEKS